MFPTQIEHVKVNLDKNPSIKILAFLCWFLCQLYKKGKRTPGSDSIGLKSTGLGRYLSSDLSSWFRSRSDYIFTTIEPSHSSFGLAQNQFIQKVSVRLFQSYQRGKTNQGRIQFLVLVWLHMKSHGLSRSSWIGQFG